MKVVLLCGGQGARWRSQDQPGPKALARVGGQPILWHVMGIYSAAGFRDFVLCLGHQGDHISEHMRSRSRGADPEGALLVEAAPGISWRVRCVDTGAGTLTAGRIRRVLPLLGGEPFLASYGDGVADLDVGRLLDFHRRHGRLATLTAVRPRSQFGILDLSPGREVRSFLEKPRLADWVNGGFFVFEPGAADYLDEGPLEERPLAGLAAARQLMAFQTEAFWACLDTYKDMVALNELCRDGQPPWRGHHERLDELEVAT